MTLEGGGFQLMSLFLLWQPAIVQSRNGLNEVKISSKLVIQACYMLLLSEDYFIV